MFDPGNVGNLHFRECAISLVTEVAALPLGCPSPNHPLLLSFLLGCCPIKAFPPSIPYSHFGAASTRAVVE